MAKGNSSSSSSSSSNDDSNSNNLSTPSSSAPGTNKRLRSKPYDANNSFVKKVATKMTDLIPQRSWISKWFNNSQDEANQSTERENPEFETYEDKQSQPPPLKRPCIRMDVTHPPGTFSIKPRNRNIPNETEPSKERFSNHNETTQDFLEPSASRQRLHRFVSSTPAFPMDTGKQPEGRPTLNMLMPEQNNNGATNGTDDNSESSESTSGCSSLIPQNNRQEAPANVNYSSTFGHKRRYIDDKLNFTNHLQSPRSLFLDSSARETLSSRQPSFNPSMMSNTLTRSSSLSSPFYTGNTTFGGANAANLYRRSNSVLSEPPQNKGPQRTSVQVNPSSNSSMNDLSGMSHTARRILEALEQFSSPLTDAKKIPIKNVMGGNTSYNSSMSSPTSSRKRPKEDDSPRVGLRHLTRELTIPTVPELLRIRRRQRLQNTTVNARKIMTARNTTNTPPTQEYHIRTEADVEPKRNAQLKAKKKTNLEEQETVEAVNLPTIPLPISNLPRFDISLPRCTKPATPERQQPQFKSDKDDSFKFASPIKLNEGAKNLESINNFTFSKPITPSKMISGLSMNESQELSRTLSLESNESISSSASFPNFIWAGPTQTLKPKEKTEEPKAPKIASELKSGSIMDFFSKTSAKSSDLSNVWECNECLIKNNEKETHCIACKSAKPDSCDDIEILECPTSQDSKMNTSQPTNKLSKSSSKSFGNINASSSPFSNFNSTPQSTSAKSNLFNSTISTTAADKTKSEITISSAITTKPTTTSNEISSTSSLLSSFKTVKDSWECPCCMVRNVETATTCPCCNTAKPGSVNVSPKRIITSTAPTATITSGFGDKFKKPEGSWSCDTCMVQNNGDVSKCVACETPRAGAAKPTNTSTTSIASGFGDKFKKPEDSWTCDSCMLSNKADAKNCIACESAKPGNETAKTSSKIQFNVDMPANTSSFKFGIDKAEDAVKSSSTASLPKTNGFTFGSGAESTPATGGFSFGVPNSDKTKDNSTGFAFKASETVPAAATFQFGSRPAETKEKDEEKKSATTANFSFGASAKSDAKPSAGFLFGAPATTAPADKKDETKPAATGFSFGASPTTSQISKDSASDKDSKADAASATSNFLFGSTKPAVNAEPKEVLKKDENKETIIAPKTEIPKLTPSFSAPTELQKSAAPSFSFGAAPASTTSTTNNSAPTPSLFTFSGQPKTSETAPLPAFGSADAPKPAFSFGKSAETATTTIPQLSTENKAPVMAFGSAATSPSFGSTTNQTTSSLFGTVGTPSTPATSDNSNKPLLFGTADNKSATPAFGEPSSKLPAFGSATDNKPAASVFPSAATPATSPFGSSTSVFGSGAPAIGSSANTSIFSAIKPSETPSATPSLFSFGQASQPAAPATSGFNFSAGSNASSASETPGIFAFGAANSTSTGPVGNGFGGGSFSAPTPATPAAAATTPSFTFNAPPKVDAAPSAFGQAAATTPMFNAPAAVATPTGQPPAYPGTASPAPAAGGFNFGNTSVPNSFSFGSTPAPAPGGYNFSAPNNSAAPVAFDPNTQPTFNFTRGSAPTAFNAPPARKIKKAVRRMPRQ